MKVLVTGGAGYIGSHTCKALKSRGHEPVVVDNLLYGHEWAVKWGPFFRADIRDVDAITSILKNEKIDAVIHFAALAYVGESMREPLKYYDNNVIGSLMLFQAMQKANVRKVVFSSSCATYGVPQKIPIDENSTQEPINPYGQTKLIVEKALKDLVQAEKFQSVSLRYFNAAGSDPDLEIGEDHSPETHLIPLAIEAIFNKDKSLTIFGTDYPTPDGTCVRDYIHVTDLADAHVKALETLQSTTGSWVAYNLGTSQGFSVKQIVESLEKKHSRKINVKWGERRPGDPPELVANAKLANEKLGWKPKFSDLDTILTTATQWYEKHHLKG